MKRPLGPFAATALAAIGAVAIGTGSVGAAATAPPVAQIITPVVPIVQEIKLSGPAQANSAQVYAVHGLNLAGQTAQDNGGTDVTVCNGDTALASDFQFGDITSPLTLPWGTPVSLKVFLGADADCTGTNALISLDTTIPEEDAIALVATAGPDGVRQLLPVVLDVTTDDLCFESVETGSTPQGTMVDDPSTASLGAVHAAAAGPVAVSIDGTTAVGALPFGKSLFAPIPPDIYSVEVTLDSAPIVGPVDLTLGDCELTVVYVVGNQLIAESATPEPAPAAEAVPAAPAFTG